ncbi:Holliday junction branch migration protein RuvA [Candidatus Falkowbacteria bacterium]|jgi:holliday junction DNA helicase RuvA|nr:Holliday junction branch migration protein RuvA [Candidatus Falkowbacteria bacterium]MBT5503767.1 Holliday junction branch migration protein RuvA [Candidatus Falkowbacteria bacterium]MBT6573944.1 Holliday junction branch migration protein RuvA [Candidatus Falkowbacteria bacterium]MBT7348354.1 Holliday junction branch migration protein RuvA [Candidatus Falkowbacteria bacterium]MBT7500261.1 Holliday junction branch migration protein RuvA [Candidatus Falkowbacteria bacterium]
MIAFISGKIKQKDGTFLVVENNGIGYKVFVPAEVLLNVKIGNDVELYTYQHVREDALLLFGFVKYEELKLFEQLISISGIGPKTALGVFTEASVGDIVSAIVNGDASVLKRVSGIGAKTAERIVLELKNKITASVKLDGLKSREEMGEDTEVIEALVSLGYSVYQSKEALKKVDPSIKDVSEKVREVLKNI